MLRLTFPTTSTGNDMTLLTMKAIREEHIWKLPEQNLLSLMKLKLYKVKILGDSEKYILTVSF